MSENIPKAVWSGSFWVGTLEIKCHTLDNGQKIIEADSLERFLAADWGNEPASVVEMEALAHWYHDDR